MRALAAAVLLLVAGTASAHLVVDMKMSVEAPTFVPARERFTYRVIADNLNNDTAFGVVVTSTLPSTVAFVRASGSGWSCRESQRKVTCSAEELGPGPHVITIEVTAPATTGPLVHAVSVESLGSQDPITANDVATVTTTVYEPSACTATAPELLPIDGTRLSWTAVPGAQHYAVYGAVESERSALVATTTETSFAHAFEQGRVEWRVDAVLGTCPTLSSPTGTFTSNGKLPTYSLRNFTNATFLAPSGVAFDSTGALFVADRGDFTIRRIAGNDVATLSGTSGASGAADGRPASFASPMGIAITPYDDFLFVADRDNHAVRLRYPGDRTLGYVITIGGLLRTSGMADGLYEVSRYSAPTGVAADPRGRLYVTDSGNHRIRKLEMVSGYIGYYTSATLAGGSEGSADGPLAQARFSRPGGVAVEGETTVYVADTGNHTIRKITGGLVTTIAGSPGVPGNVDGVEARFNAPTALAVDARGNLWVCDTGNHSIRKVSPSGRVITVATGLSSPSGIAIGANGTIVIADTGNGRIVTLVAANPRRRASARYKSGGPTAAALLIWSDRASYSRASSGRRVCSP